ncbi:protein MpABCC13 [Marchantia polymorpha subsp. ruderalis]|uniref:Uncharacterized protein n=2 Tax=Marchantia polymorpha TaxID=3197 RepID=A0A176VRC4_MARPO|nr:hypothetical protein AXG93_961s1040 [Marchantia polymorpha subsp. ruderalis]PTQ41811.1 hypothetical protein MARPO_0032s0017 [Marchantia polymorpha]BBN11596.1 hypothetical protein Mp_5g13230 [Marchantia polymorpha subsp. ruderalis]|eukprot:PTQ41811.1 hypothetical protein MARPO_0032s0017 [Marchantia polymorpha]
MDNLTERLLGTRHEEVAKGEAVTRYASANFLSRAIFSWLNPLLRKGYDKPIERDDVPALAPEHRAARLSQKFTEALPEKQTCNSVRNTLVKILWPSFFTSAALALCKLGVLYTGPIMIESFVQVSDGSQIFPNEKYYLIATLITAKMIEVFATHQCNFINQVLGMQVRSALVTALFRKGLRLSSSARQRHGLGEIVNYMSVDVQNLSDVVQYLNNVWTVPLQAILGGTILFFVVGPSAMAGLLVMGLTVTIEYVAARWLKALQQKIANSRDQRVNALMEALSNMKIIKLQAWDGKFLKNVEKARDMEFTALSKFTYTVAFSIFIAWLAPLTSCVAIFACHIALGHRLTSEMAFTTIATMRAMQELLRLFPNTLLSLSQTLISLSRLEKFMWSEELEPTTITNTLVHEGSPAITVQNGCFKWDARTEELTLKNIDIEIKRGLLVAVVGKVGSGKSSLLAAFQGEILKVQGELETCGSTAYVAQSAWLQNATIQENILFGREMEKERYDSTLRTCALLQDLSQFESLDQTEIGEKGLNLSGGQKQRIQLARAVYQNSDVYFLDDIFSAVDAHTGSQLFKEVILGALQDKTVILVTHQIDFLTKADMILVMRDGAIVQSGKYEDLLMCGTDFEALVDAHDAAMEKVEKRVTSTGATPEAFEVDLMKLTRNTSGTWQDITPGYTSHAEDIYSPESDDIAEPHPSCSRPSGKLTDDEHKETGRVSWCVYWLYLTRAYGTKLLVIFIVVQIVWQIFQISGDYWVAYGLGGTETDDELRFITIYGAFAMSCGLCVIIRSMLIGFLGLRTAQSFFMGMLQSLFKAPMSFFDTTPNGRILSRATTDQQMIDYTVPIMFGAALAVTFQIAGMLYVTCRVSWFTALLLLPLAWVYRAYQAYYFATARELTRIEGITKAPIIHHFSETIAGLATIRCFKQEEKFIQVNLDKIDSNLKMIFHSNAAMEWVGMRVETIGVAVLFASLMLLLVLPTNVIRPEMVGLALAYGLSLNQYLFDFVGLTCQLENKMISVERVAQYTQLPSEAMVTTDEPKCSPDWPVTGSITLHDLQLRYRPHTPLVLKGINVTIEAGQKVGIVGRTGSGKSTLILALFRLVEPCGGKIVIDGIDISSLGLTDLRCKIGIIPQDPTMFDGTIRSNMDPLGIYDDVEIWEALEKCQLASSVRGLPAKLDASVAADGANWSLGQRQLFCLGRVLLKRARILVLDEATASVDAHTDGVIQKIVRQEFADCTVISIAHRIPSIMDSDKVLVLEAGLVKEFDSPAVLLEQDNSLFSALVKEYKSRCQ